MEVMLTEQDSNQLRGFIRQLLIEEVEKIREDTNIDKRILNQKEIAAYFGVSSFTIRDWEGKGMPFVTSGPKLKFYDKEECRKWLMEKHR